MSVNLEGLSSKELLAVISKAEQLRAKLESRPPLAEVRRMLEALAEEQGYRLEEVFGKAMAARAGKRKVAVKYRHPTSQATWSGRGKRPNWLADELARGKTLADFAV